MWTTVHRGTKQTTQHLTHPVPTQDTSAIKQHNPFAPLGNESNQPDPQALPTKPPSTPQPSEEDMMDTTDNGLTTPIHMTIRQDSTWADDDSANEAT